MKTTAAIASAILTKAATGDISAQDIIDLIEAVEAGGSMRLPSQGLTPVTGSVTGTSWQAIDLFDGGSSTPVSGGKGVTLNLADGTMTIETGGDGWYELKYHVNATCTQDTELAIRRTRASADIQRVESSFGIGRGNASGSDLVKLQAGDVLRLVARTGSGLTNNFSFWSAQWTALRVLSTEAT